jgi:phospholipase/carboxylesterase
VFRWNALQDTEFCILHGSEDSVIPVALARRARELFSSSNARMTYREYPIGHQMSEESIMDAATWLKQRLDTIRG